MTIIESVILQASQYVGIKWHKKIPAVPGCCEERDSPQDTA